MGPGRWPRELRWARGKSGGRVSIGSRPLVNQNVTGQAACKVPADGRSGQRVPDSERVGGGPGECMDSCGIGGTLRVRGLPYSASPGRISICGGAPARGQPAGGWRDRGTGGDWI
jgi:hypothetical protein